MIDESTIKAIGALAERAMQPTTHYIEPVNGGPERVLVVCPDGRKIEDVTEKLLGMQPNPRERRGIVKLLALDSFVAFATRMREPSTVLFADQGGKVITAVFDYHDALNGLPAATEAETLPLDAQAEALPHSGPLPRWSRFRASFEFPVSRQWKAWSQMHATPLSQGGLANFLEENITDIADPATVLHAPALVPLIADLGLRLGDRSELLAAARGLQLASEEKVSQAINTTTGEVQVVYEQKHAQETVQIPSAFLLQAPVFEGDAAYLLLVRLRHRKKDTTVIWSFDIYQLDKAVDVAFKSACDTVSTTVGIPLFYGVAPVASSVTG